MMFEPRLKLGLDYLLGNYLLVPNLLAQRQTQLLLQQQHHQQQQQLLLQAAAMPCFIPPLLPVIEPQSAASSQKQSAGFKLYGKVKDQEDSSETMTNRETASDCGSNSVVIPKLRTLASPTKRICKANKQSNGKKPAKKIYEISRFFVKNYIGALRSVINNPNCEEEIMNFLGCSKEFLISVRQELESLLKENPKHNRMQLYKLMINPKLNQAFQYFLRKKVVAWIFTSSKMQDRQAHLMARKNFLYLCLNANSLTPNNFRIALNEKCDWEEKEDIGWVKRRVGDGMFQSNKIYITIENF